MYYDVRQLLVALFAGLLVLSCNEDKPTEPEPVVSYPVYFLDGIDHSRLYRYRPANNSLDSIALPFEIRWGYELSPDGDLLYACGFDSLYVVSLTDTPQVVNYIPGRYRGGVAVSNDGGLLALSGFDLEIVRTSDYSLVFSDTDQTYHGAFSDDGSVYYAIGWVETPSALWPVYRVDLNDTTDVRRTQFVNNPHLRVPIQIVPYPNDRYLMIYFRTSAFEHSFEVYDQLEDSILFSDTLVPGSGTITLHPNGNYAFYTNPGNVLNGPVPPSEFYSFNLQGLVKDETISTIDAFDDPEFGSWRPMSETAVTPDGRWLVMIHWSFDEVIAYDLLSSRFAHFNRLNKGGIFQQLRTPSRR